MARKILIIGGVATGPKAAARARRCDPDAEIVILERGEYLSYAGCAMPYYVGGVVKEFPELMSTAAGTLRDVTFFRQVKDVQVFTRTMARSIDRKNKVVEAVDLGTGEGRTFPYDRLVLATGSVPIRPDLPGLDLGRVFGMNNLEDARGIRDALDGGEVRRVVLVGGGLIGMEAADAVTMAAERLGYPIETTVVEIMQQPVPSLLDPDLGVLLAAHLRGKGIHLLTGYRVLRLEGNELGRVQRVVTDREEIPCDMVIVAVGVRPNVTLAREAGLELGTTGAIAVNEYLQTSDPDIYAGGDCVENYHLVSGKPVYMPLGSTANRHGRVIGDNVTGGQSVFPGVLGTAVFRVSGLNVARTGLGEEQARQLGYAVESVICPGSDRAHYAPGSASLVIKLMADARTRRLLGVQLIGQGEVAKRVDVMAALLSAGASLDTLANLDLAYAPPFNTAIDPLQHAANALRNKLDGRMRSLKPMRLQEALGQDANMVVLDVRSPDEVKERHISSPRLLPIPLGKLRERRGEIPRDRHLVTVCKIGLRAYEAASILKSLGYGEAEVLEGGMSAWPYETASGPVDPYR